MLWEKWVSRWTQSHIQWGVFVSLLSVFDFNFRATKYKQLRFLFTQRPLLLLRLIACRANPLEKKNGKITTIIAITTHTSIHVLIHRTERKTGCQFLRCFLSAFAVRSPSHSQMASVWRRTYVFHFPFHMEADSRATSDLKWHKNNKHCDKWFDIVSSMHKNVAHSRAIWTVVFAIRELLLAPENTHLHTQLPCQTLWVNAFRLIPCETWALVYACVSVIAFRHRSHVFSIYVFVCEYHLECLLESSGALFGFVPNDLLKATNPQQKQTKNHYSKNSLVCIAHCA